MAVMRVGSWKLGIYCDLLHVVDLQLAPDIIWSCLLELQLAGFDLGTLATEYFAWCGTTGSHVCA